MLLLYVYVRVCVHPCSTSDVVPGWYEGKYEEVPPEPPKPKAIGEDDDDDESEDEKTDDVTKQGRDAVKSTYSGSVLCVMPSLTLPESIMKAMQAGGERYVVLC